MRDYFVGIVVGIAMTLVAVVLWPEPPTPAPTPAPVADSSMVHVEEDGSIAGWGCLQGYPCDDTLHVYIPLDEVTP